MPSGHAKVERERTQQVARVGNNLNQIARWANAHKEGIEAVEVIGHLIAIRRALSALEPAEDLDADAPRGNPDMVAAVANSPDFEHRYTPGVIAWAPDDQPTDEHIEAVVDDFEKTAWAGLEPDRYELDGGAAP